MVVWAIILILCGLATLGDAQTANETTVKDVPDLPENVTTAENSTTLKDDTTLKNGTTLKDDTTLKNGTTLNDSTTLEDNATPKNGEAPEVSTAPEDVKISDLATSDVIKSDVNTNDVETAPAQTSDDGVNEEDEERREEIEGELFRQIIDYEGRPMPPELSLLIQNNTQDTDELQECMKEFAECLNMHKFYPFCAISVKLKKVRRFETMCEFNYAICKDGPDSWRYAMDEDCDVEKVQEVIKEAVSEAATKTAGEEPVNESETEPTVKEQETNAKLPAPPEFGGQTPEGFNTQTVEEETPPVQNNSNIQRMKLYYRALADADNTDDDDDKRR